MHRTLFCGRSKGARVQPHTYKHHAHKHTQNTLVIRTHARMHACTRAHARAHTHRLEEAEKDPERASSARPNSRSWKYSDLRKPPPHMRPPHGKNPQPIKPKNTKIRKQKKRSWCSNLFCPAPLCPILPLHASSPHTPALPPSLCQATFQRGRPRCIRERRGPARAWTRAFKHGRKCA